jgi:4-hydroxy 2-oxovalerate aldolase
MRQINLLDCTLRDGGYINNWHFGIKTIKGILNNLALSNVDYIECGYLSEKKGGTEDDTLFKSFDALYKVIPEMTHRQQYAAMIDFGQYDIDNVPENNGKGLILRICFHKEDADSALDYCKKLMNKGYTVFVQPMAAINYSDAEFLELIRKVNELGPKCFYIVDSFGVIEIDDFQRLLFLADHNLNENIILGYHAHNNLQQAYGNAKYMVEQPLSHDVMLDASVYGMGRGAGNLNMELFASHLNKNYGKAYNIDAFLEIMDEYLQPIFATHFWGYSLPFYLSAKYNCHPNYAGYYSEKNTLSNKSMRELLASISPSDKNRFTPEIGEKYYREYQERLVDDKATLGEIADYVNGRDVLILAPGRSISEKRNVVEDYINDNAPVIFAINVYPEGYKPHFLFCANEKRLNSLGELGSCKLIVSSNIKNAPDAMKINYSSYLSEKPEIVDNPTLMVINMLNAAGINKVAIAGFDGYSADSNENYFSEGLALGSSVELKLKRNLLIKEEIQKIRERMDLEFVTDSRYI